MSFKAKDLTYDDTQPAFLRRLRGELAGDGSGRHERPIPRNKRMKQDDEDDDPTYVLEESNESVSKAEYEALVSGKDPKEADDAAKDSEGNAPCAKSETKPKDNIAEVGKPTKKRKAAKIVGEEQDNSKLETTNTTATGAKKAKIKKKSKLIKLTFGDEEGE